MNSRIRLALLIAVPVASGIVGVALAVMTLGHDSTVSW